MSDQIASLKERIAHLEENERRFILAAGDAQIKIRTLGLQVDALRTAGRTALLALDAMLATATVNQIRNTLGPAIEALREALKEEQP